MRILHTSDWHLGRTLHKVSLADEQAAVMAAIAHAARAERVDLIVVSGDVFDHALPSAAALELFESSLVALLEVAPVVVTAGNHDSLRRLGYGARLMEKGLTLRTRVEDVGRASVFEDAHGAVRVYPIPYLHPDTAHVILAEAGEPLPRTHVGVLSEAMRRIRDDLDAHPGARSVVLAHAWVAGGFTADSERDVSVGGLGTVPSDVFSGVDYVALGHLHGPQDLKPVGRTRLRYCGSPLRYSFSEAGHAKSVTIVALGSDGVEDIRAVPLPQPRPMAVLRGLFDELLDDGLHREAVGSWVSAVVIDERRPSQMWPRLRQRFPHLLQVRHEPAGGVVPTALGAQSREQKPQEVAADFVHYVTNGAIDAAEEAVFDEAVQAVRGRLSA